MTTKMGRVEKKEQMKLNIYDCIVIGGGITGAGIALDAASRGLSVCLIEKGDYGSGTSSKSTKLIHGGLRYLKQGQFFEVKKYANEREIIYRNAPFLVEKVNLVLPLYKGGMLNRFTGYLGLTLYDFLAKVSNEDKKRYISKNEMLIRYPEIRVKDLLGGYEYVEYMTNDAQLTFTVIKNAQKFGAVCLNYCEVIDFNYDTGNICGVIVKDLVGKVNFSIKGNVVINAAGPWIEQVLEFDNTISRRLIHSKGSHIVIDGKKLPFKQSFYFDTSDGRMIFCLKKKNKFYIGTTELVLEEKLDNVICSLKEKEYLINKMKELFPRLIINLEDIESDWSGVRPLIMQNDVKLGEISRKDEIWYSDSGLITIAGGKLTGYRLMAEKVVDQIYQRLGIELKKSLTSKLKLTPYTKEIDEDLSNLEEVVQFYKKYGEVVHLEDLTDRRLNDYYFHRDNYERYFLDLKKYF